MSELESGKLEDRPFPLLLLDCYRRRVSAVLVLKREAVEKRVLLRDGVPVMADSNLPSESLGIQLLDAGRITREDYARVVDLVKTKRCKEGVALLALELVAPRELFEALKQQVRRRLLDCIGWTRGTFAMQPAEAPPEDASAFRCDPIPLIQEGVAIHWNPSAIRAALGAKLDRFIVATSRTEASVSRLYRDPAVDRLLEGIGGIERLGVLLEAAPSTALAAALVLDGVGAVTWSDKPPEADADPSDESGLDIEVVVGRSASETQPVQPSAAARPEARPGNGSPAVDVAALRDELLALHASLGDRNHYELLGVARDAMPAAIRRAYVAAAKRFHPDSVARAGLGELRAAADAVFAQISKANTILSDTQRRRDYEMVLEGGAEDIDTARLVQAESLFRKAEILLRAGNFGGALEFLRPCVALWPEDLTYQSSMGWALYKKSPSDPKTAREHLEKAIALDSNDAVAHFRLGMVLRALGETDDAEVALRRAKRLDPKVS